MKILMIGRGVIATLYGWAFERAGHSVDFYVRPGRAATYRPALPLAFYDARAKAQGVLVTTQWPMQLREDLPADHDYEVIVVSVQHYRFAEVAAFLAPRVAKATVLVFNNFWADPQQEASPLPTAQVAWGFPQAGGSITEAGLTGSLFGKVMFGSFNTVLTAREVAIRALFQRSGFSVAEQPDWRGWLWTHFAVNAGLFAQSLQAGSPAHVLRSATQRRQAIRQVRELLPVLRARGVALSARRAELSLYRLPPWLGSGVLWLLGTLVQPLRRMIESYENNEEAVRSCYEVLAAAQQLQVAVPRLETALASAQKLTAR